MQQIRRNQVKQRNSRVQQMNKRLAAALRIQRLRLDPEKTAARYDEIIKLRMSLLNMQERFASIDEVYIMIKTLSESWGKKGDCV